MIEFLHPWYLVLGLLVPGYIYLILRKKIRRNGTLRISSSILFPVEMVRRGRQKQLVLTGIEMGILCLVVLGLSGPRIADRLQQSKVDVVDIILAIDISSSMLATDFPPNRLEAVKTTAKTFIENRDADRIGILVFAGETFIQCPLTVDKQVLVNLLGEIQVVEQEYDGTAIGMAIANAANRLRNSKSKSKIIVLLSDGSNNAGELDPITAADLAAKFDIKIYTIGAGTNQSHTLIPNRGYIKNEIDEKTLKSIANRTGGSYFRATDIASLEKVYQEISKLERTEIEVREFNLYRELFGWFLIPALVLGFTRLGLDKLWKRKLPQ